MHIDLKSGVFPISAAASSLAALIKQAAKTGGPIIVTQKGRPTGVLLSVEAYERLRFYEMYANAKPISLEEFSALVVQVPCEGNPDV